MNEEGKRPDRVLGDEWSGWEGGHDGFEEIREGKGKFLIFASLAFLLFAASLSLAWYLVSPRLYGIHPLVGKVVGLLAVLFFLLAAFWFLSLVLSSLTGRKLLLFSRRIPLLIGFLTPKVIRLGGLFGISRDRMVHSFIKVSNTVMRQISAPQGKPRLLILAPRCLSRETRRKVDEMRKRYGCDLYTAGGGEAARKAIMEKRPTAVVGIACERDLLTGILDVGPRIPTIGIANIRREGPCKNTAVDLDELEEAVRFFCYTGGRAEEAP